MARTRAFWSLQQRSLWLAKRGLAGCACGHGGEGQAPAGVSESQCYTLGVCPRNFQWAYQRSICPGLTSSLSKTGQLPLPQFWLFSPSSTHFTLACHMLIRLGNWGICTRLTFGGCLITTQTVVSRSGPALFLRLRAVQSSRCRSSEAGDCIEMALKEFFVYLFV